ncbi:MAG: T9SS type A sorting domain-containing protein, partial [Bacteroidales bacterium]|nr:T9SS type A sorting domain-containing protein [Bacteroidales bacterium]
SLPIPTDYSGPDAYGYYAYSSDDAFYEQRPVYDWFELEGIGTEINIPNVSDYTVTVNIPFTFKYYGINYTQVRVSTDGWMAFGSGSPTAPENTMLPNTDNVNSMAAVFWDDLYNIEIDEGEIYYYNDDVNHRFIIQWDSIAHYVATEPKREVFQAILLDPAYYTTATGDGEIIFQYKKVEEIESNTIGIENHSQNVGLQYVFNNDYDPTASGLINEYAIKFTTEAPYIYLITSVNKDLYPGNVNGFALEQNFPNPFDSYTWINYVLPESSNVLLSIYNVRGELVCTLQNGQQTAGKYSVEWNGLNDSGNPMSSGIYFYRLQTEDFIETKKMFMLK